ncbi:MAG: DUF2243 domain-containing protein [Sulfurifustis sp.]
MLKAIAKADAGIVVFGFGMGGMFDFTFLHFILQWHQMISNRVPPVSLATLAQNNFWDGIGLGISWLITLLGMLLLARAGARVRFPNMLRFVGLFILGWGVFNLVDGIFNHHVFALHNVRDDVTYKTPWNLAFLIVAGILQPLAGYWILSASRRSELRVQRRVR